MVACVPSKQTQHILRSLATLRAGKRMATEMSHAHLLWNKREPSEVWTEQPTTVLCERDFSDKKTHTSSLPNNGHILSIAILSFHGTKLCKAFFRLEIKSETSVFERKTSQRCTCITCKVASIDSNNASTTIHQIELQLQLFIAVKQTKHEERKKRKKRRNKTEEIDVNRWDYNIILKCVRSFIIFFSSFNVCLTLTTI